MDVTTCKHGTTHVCCCIVAQLHETCTVAAGCYRHCPWSGFMLDHDAVHMQMVMLTSWAAQYNIWLLIKLTPKGIVLFLFFIFMLTLFHCSEG